MSSLEEIESGWKRALGGVAVVLVLGGVLAAGYGNEGPIVDFHRKVRVGCEVTASGGEPRDLALARSACERAIERYTQLFGEPPPGGTVEVSDTVRVFTTVHEGSEWTMIWPATDRIRESFSASAEGRSVEEAVEEHWSTVLPHELGHMMLIADADRRRSRDREARRLPDWLHEGVAVFMEPPEYRSGAYATLRAHRPFIPAIDDVLRFRIAAPEGLEGGSTVTRTFFPCASEEACGGRPYWDRSFSVRTRQYPDGRVEIDTIFHEAPPPPPSPLGSQFYAYSATLVRYLHARGGPAAIDALLDRYVRADDGATGLAGLPGLPGTAEGVEADWRRWFERSVFDQAEAER